MPGRSSYLTSYLAPSAVIYRRAMQHGILGNSRFWKAVGIAILARNVARRIMGSDPVTVGIETIKPGETVILRGVRSRDIPRS